MKPTTTAFAFFLALLAVTDTAEAGATRGRVNKSPVDGVRKLMMGMGGMSKDDTKDDKQKTEDGVVGNAFPPPEPSAVITPFCDILTDVDDAAAFCQEKGLQLPTEEEVCRYHMQTDTPWETVPFVNGVLDVSASCPVKPRTCPEFGHIHNEDNEELDPTLPIPEDCQMKRGDYYLWFSPDLDDSLFPAERTDVFVEVLIPTTGQIIPFYRDDRYTVDGEKGIFPFDSENEEDMKRYRVMYDEQEKYGGMGFKLRYNGMRGPSEWSTCSYSPIAFDLDGSGAVEHVTVADEGHQDGWKIDITGDGSIEHLSEWFASTEGILIDTHDKDGLLDFENGFITITGDHLMGDMAGKYTDGFAKLKTYDDNCDDKLTGKELDGLFIWVDGNENALLEEGELHTLAHFNIVELSVIHDDLKSHATLADGSTMVMQDLWFDRYEHDRRLKSEALERNRRLNWRTACEDAILCSNGQEEPEVRAAPAKEQKEYPRIFAGNPNCKEMGFTYGWKMDGGCNNMDGSFQELEATQVKDGATCDPSDAVGDVKIECSGEGEPLTATITPTENVFVIMKAADGGTIYHLAADTRVELDCGMTNKQGKTQAISHIEFCFDCGEAPAPTEGGPSPDPEPAPETTEETTTKTVVEKSVKTNEPVPPMETVCEDEGAGSFTMKEIAEADATGKPKPGDEVVIDGKTYTLSSTCDVVPEEEPEEEEIQPRSAPGSSSGDPHFKTWSGEKYDYHGECDLVLVDHPSFNNGQGLKVHIRTTRVKYWSYIEQVAVQIGDDVLEFDNDVVNFLINGAEAEENHRHHKTKLGGFVVRRDTKAISIRLHDEGRHDHHVAKIDLHTRRNGFPAVIVDGGNTEIFKGSLGLLGDWESGKRIARDGMTELAGHDATPFALEWQVRDTDPMLFQEARFPQFPTTCTPPANTLETRLGMSDMQKEAEQACAHWKEDKEDCIFDVIATRDVLVAEEGHIVHVA